MSAEIVATNLRQVTRNFTLSSLKADSAFYVDIDEARNGDDIASVRQRIVIELEDCADMNLEETEEYIYKKMLFVGHKASGKTTELHRIEDAVKDCYETIFIENIEQQQDRLAKQSDFIYYIVEELIRVCEKNECYGHSVEKEANELLHYLRELVYSVFSETTVTSIDFGIEAEAGAEASTPFKSILNLFVKLKAKEGFDSEKKTSVDTTVLVFMNDFIKIANSILKRMQIEARKKGKMLLIILDGLDKVSETIAEEIFLSTESFLTKLNCSMIVTFPLYLNYSPKADQAIGYFDGCFILSMVPVHERNGEDCERGIMALREIIERRMDIDKIFTNPKDVKKIILNCGGNLRDLFTFIRKAAINARAKGRAQITTSDLESAYMEKHGELDKQLVKSYVPVLNQVYWDKEKESIIAENPKDDTLLMMFNAGLLIEYNGKRWVDLHPIVFQLISERIKKHTWTE